MKINKKIISINILLLAFFILYIFLGFKPLKKNLQLTPKWTRSLIKTSNFYYSDNNRPIPFKIGQKWGYFNENGNIYTALTTQKKIALSPYYNAEYDAGNNQITFYNSLGEKQGTFHNHGNPYFHEKSIFFFYAGGNAFSVNDNTGKILWQYEDYTPITAFSASQGGCAAGFADGKILCFGQDGSIRLNIYPGGSTYEMIFGLALSKSGNYVASISGIDKQRLTLTHISNSQGKIFFHQYLDDTILEQTLVQFTENEHYAFFATKSGLKIVNIRKQEIKTIPFDEKILQIAETQNPELYFVLSKNKSKFSVRIISQNLEQIAKFSFKAQHAYLSAKYDSIYLGKDDTLSKIQIKRN